MARKKKKRRSFAALLKHALLKYGCLTLYPIVWLITPPQYDRIAIILPTSLCYVYIETFNWIHDKESDPRDKRIKLLARFWRYGYIALALSLASLCSALSYRSFLLSAIALYGVYTLIITVSMCKHFICGMQDASHQPMDPRKRRIPTAAYRRDGLFMGFFFLVLGIVGLMVA